MDTTDLISILSKNKIVIYGIGFVGLRFYDLLAGRGLEKNVGCFVVSNTNHISKEVRGVQVKAVHEINDRESCVVCVAVHETIKSEIEHTLNERKIANYIWIYPYLWELALGAPKRRNIKIAIDQIIRQCMDYRITVRYLAIENYFGMNDCGYDIYIKSQEMHCQRSTAEKRLNRFCDLIQDWEMTGYKPEYRVLVFESGELIDGFHRIALAKYFHMKEIMCDVFEQLPSWEKWRMAEEKERFYLSRDTDIMIKAGFSLSEIKIMNDTYRRIRGDV